ncbi:hypothetical protein ACMS0L_003180 [Klebsiella aerogenes]
MGNLTFFAIFDETPAPVFAHFWRNAEHYPVLVFFTVVFTEHELMVFMRLAGRYFTLFRTAEFQIIQPCGEDMFRRIIHYSDRALLSSTP